MFEFLVILCGLTMMAVLSNIMIRVFIVRPGQISKIQHLLEDGRKEEAVLYVNMRLKRHPDNPILLYWLGEILWQLGREEESVKVLESIEPSRLKSTPSYAAQLLFRLGSWYCMKDKPELSARYFSDLEKTQVEHADYRHGYGLLALKQGNLPLAVQLFNRALSLDNTYLDSLYLLGDVYVALKTYHEAYSVYSRLVQLRPSDAAIWLKLAEVSVLSGNTAKAIKFFNKAETFSDPEIRFRAACGLFGVYKETGEIFQTIQALAKAVAYSKPEFCGKERLLDLHYELAECYVAVEELEQAIIQWERILKIDPGYKDVPLKYAEFRHERLTDFFKDLLTFSGARLVERTIEFIRRLGYVVDRYELTSEGYVVVMASGDSWNIRREKTLFAFWCSSDPLTAGYVDNLKYYQNTFGAAKAVLISAGPVLSELRGMIQKRAIDLYDQNNMDSMSFLEAALEP